MYFTFCTEVVYRSFMNNIYDNKVPVYRCGFSVHTDEYKFVDIGSIINIAGSYYLPGTVEFEQVIYDYLYKSDRSFFELYNAILQFYIGAHVFILFEPGDYAIAVCEDLAHIINDWYGINPQVLVDPEDIESIKDSTISKMGLAKIGIEKERFYNIYEKINKGQRLSITESPYDNGIQNALVNNDGLLL